MRKNLIGLIVVAALLLAATIVIAATLLNYSASPGAAIALGTGTDISACTDAGPGTPTVSDIIVPVAGLITDLNVDLNISHTFVGDTKVALTTWRRALQLS